LKRCCQGVVWAALAISIASPIWAAAPRIYSLPAYQSPVRGEPDDLLLLPGYGFAADDIVVYAAIADTTKALVPPAVPITRSSAESGVAPIVSAANVPYSLTIRLPADLETSQSYAVWVRNKAGEWSNGIRINDARPLWFTPAYVYEAGMIASLSRELKLVGRNLDHAPGAATEIKLTGPQNLTLKVRSDEKPAAHLDRFIATVPLPPHLQPGEYRLSLSRDGISWISLSGTFTVRPDPLSTREFDISATEFGSCRADDGLDDTRCILRAIDAATAAGGGTVVLGKGTWDLARSVSSRIDADDGILLPRGVNLKGAGAKFAYLIRHPEWNASATQPMFTLLGRNTVQGLTFEDAGIHRPGEPFDPALRLGRTYNRVDPRDPHAIKSIDDVVITENAFSRVHPAIADGGLPIARLFVTANIFGGYDANLELAGDRYDMTYKFRVDDSVIAYNTFKPGSGPQVVASEIGASYHLDFSHNTADGASREYLYSPDDPTGWRAAFFWHMNENHEATLISDNTALCTGDRGGDGEAIAYDNNGNTFAFDKARTVLRASSDTVTVDGPLEHKQNDREVPLASYYLGHWIQVGQGKGLGQARKISAYRVDQTNSQITFTVTPAWEVEPQAGLSRISVGREFWQVYAVGNHIDHRRPLCRKSNPTARKGGVIGLWAQTADSVVEGNEQYDTDGILFLQNYSAVEPGHPEFTSWTFFQSFLEIRGNTIDGEYDWNSDCSSSGIQGAQAAAATPGSPPPTLGYGISIDHNTIIHADGEHGGAISFPRAWWDGPPPHDWMVVDNTLVHHNLIKDIAGTTARRVCGKGPSNRRIGINLDQSGMVWRTVLYANSCVNVNTPFDDGGSQTTRVCPSGVQHACECFQPDGADTHPMK